MNSFFTPARWLDGLWRNRVFVKLWGSLTITHFGGQITFLALPLTAALMLDASPLEMGLLTAMEALPFPLFGLFAGVLIDRVRKLPIIIWADIGRGLALASVPACAWAGWLSMPVLYSAGFLVGLGTVAGWPAYQVFMTKRVGRKNLVEANAKICVSDSAAQLIGPGIAGALIQWLTAPVAILADACAFLASAALLRGIPPAASDAPKHVGRSVRGEIAEGLEVIWRDGTLRTLAWALAVWNIFRHAYIAIVVLFAVGVVKPLNASWGFGRTMLLGLAGTGVAWVAIGLATTSPWTGPTIFGLGLLLLDFAATLFFVNYLTLRQAVTPDRLLGRVTATMICLTVATAPFGGVAGGWIAEHAGLRATILLAGLGAIALALLVAWASPLVKMRHLPQPQDPALTESVAEEMR